MLHDTNHNYIWKCIVPIVETQLIISLANNVFHSYNKIISLPHHSSILPPWHRVTIGKSYLFNKTTSLYYVFFSLFFFFDHRYYLTWLSQWSLFSNYFKSKLKYISAVFNDEDSNSVVVGSGNFSPCKLDSGKSFFYFFLKAEARDDKIDEFWGPYCTVFPNPNPFLRLLYICL